jgi:hypothetical protein
VSSRADADWWITPRWATEALLDRETLPPGVWEPACGDGAMAIPMAERGHRVIAQDLHDRGFGAAGHDFLLEPRMPVDVQAIVTNPPFKLATQVLEKALSFQPEVIAFFCRLAFLEGRERLAIFEQHPPARVWVFSRRVTLLHGSLAQPESNEAPSDMKGAMSFAWFVWRRHQRGPVVGWIP